MRDPEGDHLLEAHEASWIIALVRRVAGFLPEWLAVGGLNRYMLEAGPQLADVDRRLLVAFAVGLDALQDR